MTDFTNAAKTDEKVEVAISTAASKLEEHSVWVIVTNSRYVEDVVVPCCNFSPNIKSIPVNTQTNLEVKQEGIQIIDRFGLDYFPSVRYMENHIIKSTNFVKHYYPSTFLINCSKDK